MIYFVFIIFSILSLLLSFFVLFSSAPLKILSQDPISYLYAFMLKSIHTCRQKDIQMSAFYFVEKLPSQNIYKNGLFLSGDSFIKTEIGPPVENGMEIETVRI